jgi:uncharacterized RDD family membrane protein YckC
VCDAAFAVEETTAEIHEETLEPVAVSSSEPEWRLEVAHRLEAYRARRRRSRPADESQSALPFANGNGAAAAQEGPRLAGGPRRTAPSAPRRVDIAIAVTQPELDFSATDELSHPAALIPVADLRDRARAGWYDFLLLLLSYGAFLVLFGSLGGQFSFGKYDAIVYGLTFFLFYAQYFTLFTAFNGSTPGMHFCGLRVVSFDGTAPSFAQLLWRSFGYVLSAATLFLGFLWSLWDEDRLTWQDRVSQTYLTHTPPPEV